MPICPLERVVGFYGAGGELVRAVTACIGRHLELCCVDLLEWSLHEPGNLLVVSDYILYASSVLWWFSKLFSLLLSRSL